MTERKVKQWITVNGNRVPIFEGQSKEDAVNNFVSHSKTVDSDEDKKEKQIAESKNQADDLNKKEKIKDLKKQLETAKGLLVKASLRRKIEMLEQDWKGTEEEYKAYKAKKWEEEQTQKQKEYQEKKQAEEKAKKEKEAKAKEELEHELKTQPKDKVDQYKIIQENNPMNDDYHVGIRKPSDIKTWKEAMQDEDSFAWGDFSKSDARKALETGTITIYSSYPIKQGVFVSTSKVQSEQYAGGKGKKLYTKIVPLEDVAWINGDEGQFAQIRRKK